MVAARLRRVRGHLALVTLLGPLLGVASVLGFGGWLPLLAVPVLIAVVGVGWFRAIRFRPRRWPLRAAVLGAAAGIAAGAPVLPWVVCPVAAVVLGAAGWWVADKARAVVLEPYTPELADSPVEVPWQARGARGLELVVGTDRISLAGGRFKTVRPAVALSGVGSVEQVMVARRATLPVPGVGEVRVTVTPGPAVRITVPPGEWIVPTDHGREIARLVARRKALAGVD
ncbi:hypothetical protein GCM10010171_36320 [Actinokineospora fastidiosa]|uniref:Uncharacterized protein n=1 Tax=Actinokineospora fastidiosa TaxID=1816 RepID=A0A918GHR1_9PSEU|nr:hypothetical protein GCM10010171_36320 [Actinokineospora fastidiosa]